MLSGGFTYMTVSASPEIYEKQVVTVHTGDTLWDIAADWSGKEEEYAEPWQISLPNRMNGTPAAHNWRQSRRYAEGENRFCLPVPGFV